MLNTVLADIFAHDGWLSGSYVRERLIRKDGDSIIGDIDVLIPFKHFNKLKKTLVEKHNAKYEIIDYNKKESIAHFHFFIGEYTFDVFSCEDHCYLSPPDVDVNTLCWTGSEFKSWFFTDGVVEENQQLYSVLFDGNSIIERCRKKEAIALSKEWNSFTQELNKEFTEQGRHRVAKLVAKGWKILNHY